MKTFTRTNKENGETTLLEFSAAVDQLIVDNLVYAGEDVSGIEDWLSDMSTVFEAREILTSSVIGVDAGDFIYLAN